MKNNNTKVATNTLLSLNGTFNSTDKKSILSITDHQPKATLFGAQNTLTPR